MELPDKSGRDEKSGGGVFNGLLTSRPDFCSVQANLTIFQAIYLVKLN